LTEEVLHRRRTSDNSNAVEANGVYAQKKPRKDILLLKCFMQVKIYSSYFGMLISTMCSILVTKLYCKFLQLYEVDLDSGKIAQNIN